jgi:hypothetical protein
MPANEYVGLLDKNSAGQLKAGATSEYELPVAAIERAAQPTEGRPQGSARTAPGLRVLQPRTHCPQPVHRCACRSDYTRNTIQLHRLVQAVLRDQLDRTQWDNMRHSVHLMLVNRDPGDPNNAVNWPVYADLCHTRSTTFDHAWRTSAALVNLLPDRL